MKRTSKAQEAAVPVSQAEVVVDTILDAIEETTTEAIDMNIDDLELDEPQAPEQVLVTDAEIDELTTDVAPVKPAGPTITPKDLAAMFAIDQKVVRRHLRKTFADKVGHDMRTGWNIPTGDPIVKEILAHFQSKYPAQKVAK